MNYLHVHADKPWYDYNINQLTVMCTTRGELRLWEVWATAKFFMQSFVSNLHTIGQIMLNVQVSKIWSKCTSKHNLVKINHVVK